ncbi:MAG: hypothetical protein ACF8R7_10335 [Phycisphaerales bacterium JB039]
MLPVQIIAAVIIGLSAAAACLGQAPRAPDLSGRHFAGIDLPGAPVEGPLAFRCNIAWVWTAGDVPLPGGGRQAPTQRLLLEGDVRIELGPATIVCRRAAVWLQRRADGATQVFVYAADVGEANAAAITTITADRLPVHGVVRAESVALEAVSRRLEEPDDALVYEGERALAQLLGSVLGARQPPGGEAGDRELAWLIAEALREAAPSDLDRPAPIFSAEGVISFSAGHIEAQMRAGEQVATLTGGVSALYWDHARDLTIQMRAERMVVFLAARAPSESLRQVGIEGVRGIYLEGDVLVDSQRGGPDGERYTMRAPRIFYNVAADRAMILESVFWTYDDELQLPLWVRADAIRQESANQFRAEGATLSNTGFARPHLSIGATSVTITNAPRPEGGQRTLVDARNIMPKADGIPFGWFPIYAGDPRAIPLRALRVESSSANGLAIKTGWDLLGLLGVASPPGVRTLLVVDYYFGRGLALGLDASWNRREGKGELHAYSVLSDFGEDVLVTGARRDVDEETRGILTIEHIARLARQWTLRAEAAWLSDENVVQAFEPIQARQRREYATGVAIDRQDASSLLVLQARGWLNDFTPNQYLLTSQGYTAQKLPEARYVRVGDDLLGDVSPGLLGLFTDLRYSRMALQFNEPNVEDFGFVTPTQSQRAFGVDPDESIADRLASDGYTQDTVNRFDARTELTSQLASGPLRITPFAVGRLTAYDDEFEQFSPEETESTRAFGALGMRLATEAHRVDNNVDSRVFDLHRMRHIVEPSVTVWTAGATVDQSDLPVYDEQVESLADGAAVRFGLDQTFQTQRGGPGRRRTVDWLTLDGELVLSSRSARQESPIGRWVESRPEESQFGDFGTVRAAWQASEAVAVTGESIFDFDLSQQAETAVGTTVQHDPVFSTAAEIRYVNSQDSTQLGLSADYKLSDRYGFGARAVYDTDENAFQLIGGELSRRFPNFILSASLRYNDITDETSLGLSFEPAGFGQANDALIGLGNNQGQGGSQR